MHKGCFWVSRFLTIITPHVGEFLEIDWEPTRGNQEREDVRVCGRVCVVAEHGVAFGLVTTEGKMVGYNSYKIIAS